MALLLLLNANARLLVSKSYETISLVKEKNLISLIMCSNFVGKGDI